MLRLSQSMGSIWGSQHELDALCAFMTWLAAWIGFPETRTLAGAASTLTGMPAAELRFRAGAPHNRRVNFGNEMFEFPTAFRRRFGPVPNCLLIHLPFPSRQVRAPNLRRICRPELHETESGNARIGFRGSKCSKAVFWRLFAKVDNGLSWWEHRHSAGWLLPEAAPAQARHGRTVLISYCRAS